MAEKVHVFAVVRLDHAQTVTPDHVTVKEILPTLEEAEAEVDRLNRLNSDKGALYFVQTTRYFPDGRRMAANSGAGPERAGGSAQRARPKRSKAKEQ